MPKGCCAECIGDPHLRRNLFPRLAIATGTCDYCGRQQQALLAPNQLREAFELVTSVYRKSPEGECLAAMLARDWAMFDTTKISRESAGCLVADILEDESLKQSTFVPANAHASDATERWESFRTELMSKNRYFPASSIDLARLEELLPHLLLTQDALAKVWFRARTNQDGTLAYTAAEMGAPPQLRTTSGRANPAGIPYLYLASDESTAIAEVRPHTGDWVSVGVFALCDEERIIDLASPRRTVSPFVLEDERDVETLRVDVRFLELLGEELSRPVAPNHAAFAYAPSQYLCEYIKNCEYTGVRYASSVSKGLNLALFAPKNTVAQSVQLHRITDVQVSHRPEEPGPE